MKFGARYDTRCQCTPVRPNWKSNSYEEKTNAGTSALKDELKDKLSKGHKINDELPKAELSAKMVEETHQLLSNQLQDVKQSLKIAKV